MSKDNSNKRKKRSQADRGVAALGKGPGRVRSGKEVPSEPEQPVSQGQKHARRFVIQLLVIGAGALVLRLISVAELHGTPLFEVLLGDAKQYDDWARQIAAGHWIGTEIFYQTPLYPYFMGLVFGLGGHNVLVVRLLQSAFGATACVLLGFAGRRFFNERVGLIAASLLAIYPPAIFFDALIQKSSLDVLFVTSMLAAIGACLTRPRVRWLVALGLAMGALMLNRENARVLYPIILAWLLVGFRTAPLRMRLGWAGFVTVAAALVLAPVAIRSYYVGREFVLSTSQLGPNIYIGNHANAPGTYEGLVPDRGNAEFERIDATRLAEAARGRKLSPGEVSDYWLGQSIEYVRSQPIGWLGLMARKVGLTFAAREAADTESIEAYAEYSRVLRFMSWFNFGVVLPIAVLGVWLTRNDWRRLVVLYAFVAGFAASVVIFYVMARYRYPMVPVILLFAAASLGALSNLRRVSASRLMPGVILALIVAVLANLPSKIPGDNTKVYLGSELFRMGRAPEAVPLLRQSVAQLPDYAPAHFSLALALGEVGEHQQALEEYETTVRLWPEDFKAREALALALQEAGRPQEALRHFREAARFEPGSAAAQNNLAIALHQAGNPAEAIPHYEAAIALTPDYAEGHSNLARALAETGRGDEAVAHFKEALRTQPGDVGIHINLADLLMDRRRVSEAVAQYEQAVSLAPESPDVQTRLAQAYARSGRCNDAVERFTVAIKVARDAGQDDVIPALLDSIKKCQGQSGRPRR